MIQCFDNLGVFISPHYFYNISESGTANSLGFIQSSVGVRWDVSGIYLFKQTTNSSSGSGTVTSNYGWRPEGPNIRHPVVRSGFTYSGALRVRARVISKASGITAMGIFNTWMDMGPYDDVTQRIWGVYSTGSLGSIDYYLDFALVGGEDAYRSARVKCSLF